MASLYEINEFLPLFFAVPFGALLGAAIGYASFKEFYHG